MNATPAAARLDQRATIGNPSTGLLDSAGWSAFAVLTAVWIATLWAAPVLALQDVPDWIFQGWLLERLLAGDPVAAAVALHPYPVPNTLVTVLAGVLVPWFEAETIGRLLAMATLATVAVGAASLSHAHRAGGWVAMLIFAGVGLSTPFILGYLAFILGLGLLAIALAADHNARLNWRAVAGWSLLLFFTHAIAFAVFVLAIGWRHVALLRLRHSALALLPSLACAGWYAIARWLEDAALATADPPPFDVLAGAWERIRWKPFTAAAIGGWRELRAGDVSLVGLDALGTHWMIAFNLLFAAVLAVVAVRAIRARLARAEIARAQLLPVAALLVLFLAAPPVDFFGMINAGERFWLAACLLLLPLARPRSAVIATMMIASLPAQTLNVVSLWRIGEDTVVGRSEPPSGWHPFIVPLASRLAVVERIDSEIAPRIDPGYTTGILRNR